MYVHYFTRLCDYFLVFTSLDTDILEVLCVVGAGANWSTLSHVHSRLTMSLSTVGWAVYRCLHSLPTVTVWLGCPSFGGLA
jgi:hypothetical protein